MRPGIVACHGETSAQTLLCAQEKRVVASRPAVVPFTDIREFRTLDRINQSGHATAVCVGRGRTDGAGRRVEDVALSEALSAGVGITWEKDCGVQFTGPVQMHDLISNVA